MVYLLLMGLKFVCGNHRVQMARAEIWSDLSQNIEKSVSSLCYYLLWADNVFNDQIW